MLDTEAISAARAAAVATTSSLQSGAANATSDRTAFLSICRLAV